MNQRSFFLVVPVLALVFLAVWWPTSAQEKGAHRLPKWEYKVFDSVGQARDSEAALNRLGEEGWECCSAISLPTGGVDIPIRSSVRVICKRQK
jgi:hypothetical protein